MISTERRLYCSGIIAVFFLALQLAGCSTQDVDSTSTKATTGRYQYDRDFGPSGTVDVSKIPDAVPRFEERTSAGNKSPYTVLGNTYTVLNDERGYRAQGIASWYGMKFDGHSTSNGEKYDIYKMTGAHKTLPIPSYARVTNLDNGRSVIVRINDRGPFHDGRIIDLSYAAATRLGYANIGTARVEVAAVTPDSMAPGTASVLPASDKTPVSAAIVQNNANDTVAMKVERGGKTVSMQEDTTQNYQMPPNTSLQAGAFSTRAAAENVRQKLSGLTNYPVTVSELSQANKTLYRVRVGPVIDNAALLELRDILQRNVGTPSVVYD